MRGRCTSHSILYGNGGGSHGSNEKNGTVGATIWLNGSGDQDEEWKAREHFFWIPIPLEAANVIVKCSARFERDDRPSIPWSETFLTPGSDKNWQKYWGDTVIKDRNDGRLRMDAGGGFPPPDGTNFAGFYYKH